MQANGLHCLQADGKCSYQTGRLPRLLWGWLGGAKVLGKLSVLERPTNLVIVGQGPITLPVGIGGGCFLFFLPLCGRRPDID